VAGEQPVAGEPPVAAGRSRAVTASPAVRAVGVTLAHGREVALRDVDLELPARSVTALIGPNGSGKSTFLDALAGLVPVRTGTLEVLGGTPTSARPRVAYVLQETPVGEHLPLSVRAVVRMGRYAHRGALQRLRAEDHRLVDRAMERLEVTALADRQLGELSGGQRQRVFVAQGLAQGGDLLLLDEPVNGLDAASRQRILEVVAEEAAAGTTIVVTTHDLDDARRADRVVLVAGAVVAQGTPGEVLVPEVLRRAYGGRLLVAGEGELVLDDPHHH
jgi:manganese transport system ATP-binding protein